MQTKQNILIILAGSLKLNWVELRRIKVLLYVLCEHNQWYEISKKVNIIIIIIIIIENCQF
jgi:hypothetical protein